MNDLQILLARIEKLLAEREAENVTAQGTAKDKWRERGVDSGLEWAAQEARNILEDSDKRSK